MFTGSPEPRRLWIRVLKQVYPDLARDEQGKRRPERLVQQANDALVPKGSLLDPWKTWAQAQQTTPLQSSYPPPVAGPEAFAVLCAACAVLCLLLFGILAALREIVGRATCLSFLVLLTAAVLWFIAKNSKLSYHHKTRSVAAVASAMMLIGICLLSTSRATPFFLSARAATARAAAAPVNEGNHLDLVNAHRAQTKTPSMEETVTLPRRARGASAGSQLTGYIEAVKNSVTQKWNLSEVAAATPAGATVYIQFAVRRHGNHDVPTVETSSGSSSLDASCLRAINRAPGFGHFPNSYTGDSLTVLYHCTYPGSPAIQSAEDSTQQHVAVEPTNDSMVIK